MHPKIFQRPEIQFTTPLVGPLDSRQILFTRRAEKVTVLGASRNNRNRRIARIKWQVEQFLVLLTAARTLFFSFGNQIRSCTDHSGQRRQLFDGDLLSILIAKNLPTLRANADYCIVLMSQIVLVNLHDIPTSAFFTQPV